MIYLKSFNESKEDLTLDELDESQLVHLLDIQQFEGYNKPRKGMKRRWSVKYKKSINCSNPKGFSQKQYCKRRKLGRYKS